MHRDESYLLEALKNGAAAYILKDSSVEELVKAAVEAVAGRRYLSSPLSQSAIDAYVQRASAATLA
jgi:two-component system response regulator NreC